MVRRALTELREEMRAVVRGDRKSSSVPATTLRCVLSDDALHMLKVISVTPSTTVRDLAQRFCKAEFEVSRVLQRLAAYGILRLVRDGREVRPVVSSNDSPSFSDHQRLDARSLALHCLIAKKLLDNPALIDRARSTIARWRAQYVGPLPSYFAEWGRVLDTSPEEIAGFLVSMKENAIRLRQSSPFTEILTPDERFSLYEVFR
jgi:hypothetical protein